MTEHVSGIGFSEMKSFLDKKAEAFNNSSFIDDDPISIPHQYSDRRDIEIAAFLTASIAWGNRKAILSSAGRMMQLLDNSPYQFISSHRNSDLKPLRKFVHRTFNGGDFVSFVQNLAGIYRHRQSLEDCFLPEAHDINMAPGISRFRNEFFSFSHETRTLKHVSDPMAGSAAKRINMFLRWMVRNDGKGVDFGIWNKISPAQLSIPLDVHSGNVARKLGLLRRHQNDQKAVQELDATLRKFDANDPVRYDFALFGLGAIEKF
jgi:uncharacterized protein (TIGR02757 family)